jgi:phosphoserine phosphatase
MQIKNVVSDWDGVFTKGKTTEEMPLRAVGIALFKESLKTRLFSPMKKYPQCRFFHLLQTKNKLEDLYKKKRFDENFDFASEMYKIFNKDVIRGLPTDFIYPNITKALDKNRILKGVSREMLDAFAELRRKLSRVFILSNNYGISIITILCKTGYSNVFDDIDGTKLIKEDGIAIGFGYEAEGKKGERLLKKFDAKEITAQDTAYIGDDAHDIPCFEIVKFPIVSPYATEDFKQLCAVKYKAFASKDVDDLKKYITMHNE